MDNTKKMYIDQILQRNAMLDETETYQELIQSELYGHALSNNEITRKELEQKKLENEQKRKKQ